MRLIQTLIVIAITPLCMICSVFREVDSTVQLVRDIWSEEL